ncbi:Protein DEFECTIVE IN MERISTEM SILENCING 3 [Dichanthelium oligosanthes]|uniref:Protein DEFECTIVE IN MERISTEM SILENCING 3 n=1 Tax=Dichanthelium oligosanthes TaxID=888268 RepID=A0A1E5WCD3_9POAL|nr:Protein DEFECTIVE IN MERISTEM SILENCING 3 [Dichanthelium oligosanthes]
MASPPLPSQIVEFNCKVMEDKLKSLDLKVNHHDENIRFLKSQINAIEEACVDLGIKLGNYHSSVAAVANNDTSAQEAEQRTIRSILDQDKTAAGIICQLKVHHYELASRMPLMKDILGFVATLGKVNDDNLSRLLSEYLGMDNMLALVCKTNDGVKGLEKYKDGIIDKSSGVHGLGRSVGKVLDGRFTVFCLENLRTFSGDVNIDDPQRKLILHRPRLPGGESPPGFLDFAVNMIHLDRAHLSCLTASGHGLRETLFYSLFSHLQVYKSRADIQRALPLINDGAISLDGGILKPNGSFCLGDSKNLEVKFPVSLEVSSSPENIVEMEEQVKLKNWEKERLLEDMKREEDLLKQVKELYSKQKQELMDYLTHPAMTRFFSHDAAKAIKEMYAEALPLKFDWSFTNLDLCSAYPPDKVSVIHVEPERDTAVLKKHPIPGSDFNRFLPCQAPDKQPCDLPDLEVKLGNYHSSIAAVANNDTSAQEAEQRTIRSILDQDRTAAAIICELRVRHFELASKMPLMKDILGFVATLGKVNDDNLSRLLAEFLGMDNMLALVCKNSDGVKALEKYDKDGIIDKSSGVHGLGRSVGKFLDERFTVFCLENLRYIILMYLQPYSLLGSTG